jgi:pimeloyl-ACP methyl ester carboxylesterase
VREHVDVLPVHRAGVRRVPERVPDRAEHRLIELPPALPAEHGRRIDQHDLLLARLGLPASLARSFPRDIPQARKRFYGGGYQDISNLPEDVVRAWVQPVFGTAQSARQFQQLVRSVRARHLLAVEPALTQLQVPTFIVWGTGDIFFKSKWAYWLRDTIPGATEVIEFDRARLFFPDERAEEFTAALRRHWDAHP